MEKSGKREANKAEKKARITAAARQAFLERGFSGATIQDIAKAAHVAKGTMFRYARHKGDLLSQVFHDELEPVISKSLTRPLDRPLPRWLLQHFNDVTGYTRRHPELCRMFLKELAWVSGDQRPITAAFMEDWRLGLQRVLASAVDTGEIGAAVDLDTLGLLLIDMLLAAMRRWLSDIVSFEEMSAYLPRAVHLLYEGIQADRMSHADKHIAKIPQAQATGRRP